MKKPPRKGDRITVIVLWNDNEVRRAWRTIVVRRGRRTQTLVPQIGPLILQLDHEGKTWVRGWTTPDALALRAEIALENCR